MISNDAHQSDTFDILQNRNFETLMSYEDHNVNIHKDANEIDSLDLLNNP